MLSNIFLNLFKRNENILFGLHKKILSIIVHYKIIIASFLVLLTSIVFANETSCTMNEDAEKINIEELFEKQQQMNQQLNDVSVSPGLFVFVSFSMPEQSLKELARQTNKAGGTLLFRGFYRNSIKETSDRVMTIFGEGAAIKVDPESFRRFQIKVVPSVVVVSNQNNFDVVSGDISLEEALAKISSKGSMEVKQISGEFLEKCRK